MKQKISTLIQLYREGAKILEEAEISDASLDAWYLLEYVTGINKATYFGDPNRPVSEEMVTEYFQYIEERRKHIPLQHITNEQEFMGYPFYVNEHVLVPRQDTEVLVEEALSRLQSDMRILDLCTGSGCILLSLLKRAEENYKITGLTGVGVDISEEALEVAKRNREALGCPEKQVHFLQGDLFEALGQDSDQEQKFHILVSNPPYIRTAVIEELDEEVKLHDPYIALDGKEDGLYFYERIIREVSKYLVKPGYLLFEIGYDQGKQVSDLMKKAGFCQVTVKKDLAGLDRVVYGRLE